jgi:hypothetical protein
MVVIAIAAAIVGLVSLARRPRRVRTRLRRQSQLQLPGDRVWLSWRRP